MLDARMQRRQKARNVAQGVLLLGGLLAVAAGFAFLVFGPLGLVWILVVGAVGLSLGPRIPARTVLAMYGAQPLPYEVTPDLHRMVEALTERAGLHRQPVLYYVPSPVPNCFCVGQGSEVALAVTDGLLRRLTRREVLGVLAHEIGHLRAGDTRIMALSDAISRLTQWLAYLGVFSVLVSLPLVFEGEPRLLVLSAALVALPAVVTLLQLALSRSREFDADLSAARLTGDPEGLATALEALELSTGRLWERILVARSRVPDPLLLRTHPSTAERVHRLRELELPGDRWLAVGRQAPPLGYAHVEEQPRLRFPGVRW